MIAIQLTVNGHVHQASVRPYATLLDVLRDQLGLFGTHEGCRVGECGACTVWLDGRPVNACLILAPEADGRTVTTVEGLAPAGQLSRVQRAFVEHGALQCGFCTPGMLMTAAALLAEPPDPLTEAEVRAALAGHLCRCTGYAKIVEAILAAAHD